MADAQRFDKEIHIIAGRWILPIASAPIAKGAVAFGDGRIIAAGPAKYLRELYREASFEDLGNAAILPGFVNAHSHLEITALRGALDSVEHDFRSWLLKLNRIRSEMSEEEIEVAAVAGAIEGLRGGVTCFGDIGRYGRAGLNAVRNTELRGIIFQETDFSPDNSTAADDIEKLKEKFLELRAEATDRVEVGLSPHSPYTVSSRLFGSIAEFAAAEKIKVTIHAAESAHEKELLENGTGFFTHFFERIGVDWPSPECSAIEYLERTGILAAKPLLAHCVTVSDADIELIKASGASIAHCPKSNAKFGHGYAPLSKFIDAGVGFGLGSDSVSSNNSCDMFEEMRSAAFGARNHSDARRFITPDEMLAAATIGGARALGLDDRVGTLEAGKRADITVVSLGNIGQQPVSDVCAALVFSTNARDVIMTIVDGKTVYRDGECLTADEAEISAKLQAVGSRIA